MEEENKKERGKNAFIAVLILIIIVLVALLVLQIKGKIDLKNGLQDDETAEEKNISSIKSDDSLDYVYDANYQYDNKYTEYNRNTPEKEETGTIDIYGINVEFSYNRQSLKNLKVPFININSESANTANKELEKLYLKYAEEFDKCAKDMEEGGYKVGCSQVLTYRVYQYNNILSLVVIDSKQQTSTWVLNYHTYNFDLKTGNLLNYNDLLSKLNLDKESTTSSLKQLSKEKMDEIASKWNMSEELSEACHYNKDESGKPVYGTTNCYDITSQLLEKSINDNNILLFVDNDGNLNVIAIMYLAFAQNGDSNHYLITLSK